MPEGRLERTRQAYKKDDHYAPCERYTDHLISRINNKCIFCDKNDIELSKNRNTPLVYNC